MKPSIIHIVLGAIILAGMSACTQQEHVATEHPVAIVDSLQQIVAEEVQARVNRTEAEWGVGILMDVHSGTVVAMYDTDSTLVHAQSAWEMDSIVSPLALLAAYSVEPHGWDTVATVCREGVTYNGPCFETDPHVTLLSLCPMPLPRAARWRCVSICSVCLSSSRHCCQRYSPDGALNVQRRIVHAMP